jgi:hypothetical protein
MYHQGSTDEMSVKERRKVLKTNGRFFVMRPGRADGALRPSGTSGQIGAAVVWRNVAVGFGGKGALGKFEPG